MHRKLMEDPLLLIRKQEEETKKQITNNPVKMRQLQQLVSYLVLMCKYFGLQVRKKL